MTTERCPVLVKGTGRRTATLRITINKIGWEDESRLTFPYVVCNRIQQLSILAIECIEHQNFHEPGTFEG